METPCYDLHEILYLEFNMATITVRLVRSFEYRNMKSVVLRNVDLDISVEEFKVLIVAGIKRILYNYSVCNLIVTLVTCQFMQTPYDYYW